MTVFLWQQNQIGFTLGRINMKPKLQISRIEDCIEWLELSADDYTSTHSIAFFIDQIGVLCKTMAFVNGQMTVAKQILNDKKKKSYESLAASSIANEDYFAPSLAKDYIASKVSEDQYNYDICERCSRTIVHTLDCLRTAVSALKEETKVNNYQ